MAACSGDVVVVHTWCPAAKVHYRAAALTPSGVLQRGFCGLLGVYMRKRIGVLGASFGALVLSSLGAYAVQWYGVGFKGAVAQRRLTKSLPEPIPSGYEGLHGLPIEPREK